MVITVCHNDFTEKLVLIGHRSGYFNKLTFCSVLKFIFECFIYTMLVHVKHIQHETTHLCTEI